MSLQGHLVESSRRIYETSEVLHQLNSYGPVVIDRQRVLSERGVARSDETLVKLLHKIVQYSFIYRGTSFGGFVLGC